ncbi:DUF3060 domain-containing protein [Thermus caldilimi]|uniref:DUF3060 domain-containing protein n=1 Tax=Thermus caldilimi TaxID=2483360 RepID=UPI0010761272
MEIRGVGNVVDIQSVRHIVVTGAMNTVTRRQGASNRKLQVSNTGLNSKVSPRR